MEALSGFAVMVIAVMAVVIVIMGLALWKHRTPAQEFRAVGAWAKEEVEQAGDWLKKTEPSALSEAEKLLERAQAWLTDTTKQDEKIAEHRDAIVALEAEKAQRAAMLKLHVEKLQALSTPPAASS
jgi:hypothetical protein